MGCVCADGLIDLYANPALDRGADGRCPPKAAAIPIWVTWSCAVGWVYRAVRVQAVRERVVRHVVIT